MRRVDAEFIANERVNDCGGNGFLGDNNEESLPVTLDGGMKIVDSNNPEVLKFLTKGVKSEELKGLKELKSLQEMADKENAKIILKILAGQNNVEISELIKTLEKTDEGKTHWTETQKRMDEPVRGEALMKQTSESISADAQIPKMNNGGIHLPKRVSTLTRANLGERDLKHLDLLEERVEGFDLKDME